MKLLIIPDPHANPDYDNDRFKALGKFIMHEKPEVIVCLGDMADLPSLSSYDRGTKGFEGRRYRKDIEATHQAQIQRKTKEEWKEAVQTGSLYVPWES